MYKGPERRKHNIFVTENSEYHMRGKRCIGVRHRDSGSWDQDHAVLGTDLIASIGKGINFKTPPTIGERLCFSGDILTSQVIGSRRPSVDTASHYRPTQAELA